MRATKKVPFFILITLQISFPTLILFSQKNTKLRNFGTQNAPRFTDELLVAPQKSFPQVFGLPPKNQVSQCFTWPRVSQCFCLLQRLPLPPRFRGGQKKNRGKAVFSRNHFAVKFDL